MPDLSRWPLPCRSWWLRRAALVLGSLRLPRPHPRMWSRPRAVTPPKCTLRAHARAFVPGGRWAEDGSVPVSGTARPEVLIVEIDRGVMDGGSVSCLVLEERSDGDVAISGARGWDSEHAGSSANAAGPGSESLEGRATHVIADLPSIEQAKCAMVVVAQRIASAVDESFLFQFIDGTMGLLPSKGFH